MNNLPKSDSEEEHVPHSETETSLMNASTRQHQCSSASTAAIFVPSFLRASQPDVENRSRAVIHVAACSGQWGTVEAFLLSDARRGGEVNGKDADGNTPLHLACLGMARNSCEALSRDFLRTIRVLRRNGANSVLVNKHKQTPLHLLASSIAVASPLHQQTQPEDSLTNAVRALLLKNDADDEESPTKSDHTDANRRKHLHAPSQRAQNECGHALALSDRSGGKLSLLADALLYAVDVCGQTPLHVALMAACAARRRIKKKSTRTTTEASNKEERKPGDEDGEHESEEETEPSLCCTILAYLTALSPSQVVQRLTAPTIIPLDVVNCATPPQAVAVVSDSKIHSPPPPLRRRKGSSSSQQTTRVRYHCDDRRSSVVDASTTSRAVHNLMAYWNRTSDSKPPASRTATAVVAGQNQPATSEEFAANEARNRRLQRQAEVEKITSMAENLSDDEDTLSSDTTTSTSECTSDTTSTTASSTSSSAAASRTSSSVSASTVTITPSPTPSSVPFHSSSSQNPPQPSFTRTASAPVVKSKHWWQQASVSNTIELRRRSSCDDAIFGEISSSPAAPLAAINIGLTAGIFAVANGKEEVGSCPLRRHSTVSMTFQSPMGTNNTSAVPTPTLNPANDDESNDGLLRSTESVDNPQDSSSVDARPSPSDIPSSHPFIGIDVRGVTLLQLAVLCLCGDDFASSATVENIHFIKMVLETLLTSASLLRSRGGDRSGVVCPSAPCDSPSWSSSPFSRPTLLAGLLHMTVCAALNTSRIALRSAVGGDSTAMNVDHAPRIQFGDAFKESFSRSSEYALVRALLEMGADPNANYATTNSTNPFHQKQDNDIGYSEEDIDDMAENEEPVSTAAPRRHRQRRLTLLHLICQRLPLLMLSPHISSPTSLFALSGAENGVCGVGDDSDDDFGDLDPYSNSQPSHRHRHPRLRMQHAIESQMHELLESSGEFSVFSVSREEFTASLRRSASMFNTLRGLQYIIIAELLLSPRPSASAPTPIPFADPDGLSTEIRTKLSELQQQTQQHIDEAEWRSDDTCTNQRGDEEKRSQDGSTHNGCFPSRNNNDRHDRKKASGQTASTPSQRAANNLDGGDNASLSRNLQAKLDALKHFGRLEKRKGFRNGSASNPSAQHQTGSSSSSDVDPLMSLRTPMHDLIQKAVVIENINYYEKRRALLISAVTEYCQCVGYEAIVDCVYGPINDDDDGNKQNKVEGAGLQTTQYFASITPAARAAIIGTSSVGAGVGGHRRGNSSAPRLRRICISKFVDEHLLDILLLDSCGSSSSSSSSDGVCPKDHCVEGEGSRKSCHAKHLATMALSAFTKRQMVDEAQRQQDERQWRSEIKLSRKSPSVLMSEMDDYQRRRSSSASSSSVSLLESFSAITRRHKIISVGGGTSLNNYHFGDDINCNNGEEPPLPPLEKTIGSFSLVEKMVASVDADDRLRDLLSQYLGTSIYSSPFSSNLFNACPASTKTTTFHHRHPVKCSGSGNKNKIIHGVGKDEEEEFHNFTSLGRHHILRETVFHVAAATNLHLLNGNAKTGSGPGNGADADDNGFAFAMASAMRQKRRQQQQDMERSNPAPTRQTQSDKCQSDTLVSTSVNIAHSILSAHLDLNSDIFSERFKISISTSLNPHGDEINTDISPRQLVANLARIVVRRYHCPNSSPSVDNRASEKCGDQLGNRHDGDHIVAFLKSLIDDVFTASDSDPDAVQTPTPCLSYLRTLLFSPAAIGRQKHGKPVLSSSASFSATGHRHDPIWPQNIAHSLDGLVTPCGIPNHHDCHAHNRCPRIYDCQADKISSDGVTLRKAPHPSCGTQHSSPFGFINGCLRNPIRNCLNVASSLTATSENIDIDGDADGVNKCGRHDILSGTSPSATAQLGLCEAMLLTLLSHGADATISLSNKSTTTHSCSPLTLTISPPKALMRCGSPLQLSHLLGYRSAVTMIKSVIKLRADNRGRVRNDSGGGFAFGPSPSMNDFEGPPIEQRNPLVSARHRFLEKQYGSGREYVPPFEMISDGSQMEKSHRGRGDINYDDVNDVYGHASMDFEDEFF